MIMGKSMLKIIAFYLMCVFIVFSADRGLILSTPDSLSSIPIMELENRVVNGYKISVVKYQDHMVSFAEFLKRSDVVLVTGFTQGVAASSSGSGIKMINNIVWGVSSIITASPAIKTISDLNNKKILVPFAGSPLELQMIAISRKNEALAGIKLEYAPMQQMGGLLLTGRADAAAMPEPVASRLLSSDKFHKVAAVADLWGQINGGDVRSPQISVFIKNVDSVGGTDTILAINRELDAIIDDINKNKEKYARKYASVFNLSQKEMLSAINGTIYLSVHGSRLEEKSKDYLFKIGRGEMFSKSMFIAE